MGKRGPQPKQAKSKLVGVRVPLDLLSDIEQAAEEKNTSLSQEVIRRLSQYALETRRIEDQFGSRKNYQLLKFASYALQINQNWSEDPATFDLAVAEFFAIIERTRPGGPRDKRDLAMSVLNGDTDIWVDALWWTAKTTSNSGRRANRTHFEHLAMQLKGEAQDLVDRADPFSTEQERDRIRGFLRMYYPQAQVDHLDDNQLVAGFVSLANSVMVPTGDENGKG